MNRFKLNATVNQSLQSHPHPLSFKLVEAEPAESTSPSEPVFICFESTGIPANYADLACQLASVHSDCLLIPDRVSFAEYQKSEVAQAFNKLKGNPEDCQLLMRRVDQQLDQLNTFVKHFQSAFSASVSDPSNLCRLHQQLAPELSKAGLAYDAPSHLYGWSSLLIGALENLHYMRKLCQCALAEHTDTVERIVMRGQILSMVQTGALALVNCLEDPQNKAAQTFTGRRALMHLQQHLQDPLTKSWYWMLDESGENDDEE